VRPVLLGIHPAPHPALLLKSCLLSAVRPKNNEEVAGSNLASILPALSGSCALLAYLDVAAEDLYVALAGDCRAVAGYWVEQEQKWRVEVLSDDQTGRNPKELARIRGEHPDSERDNVVRRGRILGGLEPSRAVSLPPLSSLKQAWS
jgi:serine/threonine protein phosphatase PrpC